MAYNPPIGSIYHLYIAFWGVICRLPPFRGTRNNHWTDSKTHWAPQEKPVGFTWDANQIPNENHYQVSNGNDECRVYLGCEISPKTTGKRGPLKCNQQKTKWNHSCFFGLLGRCRLSSPNSGEPEKRCRNVGIYRFEGTKKKRQGIFPAKKRYLTVSLFFLGKHRNRILDVFVPKKWRNIHSEAVFYRYLKLCGINIPQKIESGTLVEACRIFFVLRLENDAMKVDCWQLFRYFLFKSLLFELTNGSKCQSHWDKGGFSKNSVFLVQLWWFWRC